MDRTAPIRYGRRPARPIAVLRPKLWSSPPDLCMETGTTQCAGVLDRPRGSATATIAPRQPLVVDHGKHKAGERRRPQRQACLDAFQSATSATLQQAQTAALLSLLNLNSPPDPTPSVPNPAAKPTPGFKTPTPSGPPVWKILVLDHQTKDVLATVLRVQDLRDVGVTLHV